jgi:hypothetical protein
MQEMRLEEKAIAVMYDVMQLLRNARSFADRALAE